MAKTSFFENSPTAPGAPPAQGPGSPSGAVTHAPSSFFPKGGTPMLGNANGLIYGLAVVIPGSTMLANEWLFGHEFAVVVNFAANFAGSYAYAKIAATSPSVFILTKNGTQFGTLTFTGTAGVFSSTATSFAIGDTLELIAPASPDTTLAKLAITLYGTM